MMIFMQQGGIIMWLILAFGAVAVVLFLERAFHLHRARIKTDDFIKGICNILRRNNVGEAISICDETPGPVAQIVKVAIRHHDEGREAITHAVDDAAFNEIARMERRFGAIATIAQVAPLLGLLGTVVGMMQTYLILQQKAPLVHAGDVAGGIWLALTATAVGLIVAIFCFVAYNMLVVKVDAIVLDMERMAGEIVDFLTGSGKVLRHDSVQVMAGETVRNGGEV